jgi:hypothetical protein
MVRSAYPAFAAYTNKAWVINLLIFLVNWIEEALFQFARFAHLMAACSALIITVAVLAASLTKQSADFVFTDFNNSSGWPVSVAFSLESTMPTEVSPASTLELISLTRFDIRAGIFPRRC